MDVIAGCREGVEALAVLLGVVDAEQLPGRLAGMSDDEVVAVVEGASAVIGALDAVRIAAVGVVARRSGRDRGHGGLAQKRGHRSSVSLVQELTGATRSEATTRVRIGEALLEGASEVGPVADGVEDATAGEADPADAVSSRPWHAVLGDALLAGSLTAVQHDAIRRGLGEPPDPSDEDARKACDSAWRVAATQLIDEAAVRTVEELRIAARTVRDILDPEGAQRRFDERFQARSFRMWMDENGIHRASVSFDDDATLWVRSVIDAALRPRRGGPRFVDADEAAAAQRLVDDPRTNDQLTYDLIVDTIRAGTLADTAQVFGARQPGVRVVITADALTRTRDDAAASVGHSEDATIALPGWLIDQRTCTSGQVRVVIDRDGNPLFLGREQRLFSPRQRVALAVRDGGCRWRGCDRPPSYCEAHHIDHYSRDEGRTDVDRGILLCRFHHMQLHHGGWRITRDGSGEFVLHPPDGATPVELPPRLALTYAWAGIDPPPPRFTLAA